MENASKALIIAGAILISILIVGLGVIIYNKVSGIAQSGTLSEHEISAHNSPIEQQFGDHVSGTNVKSLLSKVNSNNRTAMTNDEKIGNLIYVQFDGTVITNKDSGTVDTSGIKTGRTYTVDYSDTEAFSDTDSYGDAYWANGYIKSIKITTNEK